MTFYDLSRILLNPTPTVSESSSVNNDRISNDHSTYDEYKKQSDFSTVPPPKIKMHTIPTVKFVYCHS